MKWRKMTEKSVGRLDSGRERVGDTPQAYFFPSANNLAGEALATLYFHPLSSVRIAVFSHYYCLHKKRKEAKFHSLVPDMWPDAPRSGS
jgi:hypothetical protein